jgi:hypothetical protein
MKLNGAIATFQKKSYFKERVLCEPLNYSITARIVISSSLSIALMHIQKNLKDATRPIRLRRTMLPWRYKSSS